MAFECDNRAKLDRPESVVDSEKFQGDTQEALVLDGARNKFFRVAAKKIDKFRQFAEKKLEMGDTETPAERAWLRQATAHSELCLVDIALLSELTDKAERGIVEFAETLHRRGHWRDPVEERD